MKVIEIIIDAKGAIRIETKGFVGAECEEASQALEASLGVRSNAQRTSEFYAPQSITQSQRLSRCPLSPSTFPIKLLLFGGPMMSLTERLSEYVRAGCSAIWIQSF